MRQNYTISAVGPRKMSDTNQERPTESNTVTSKANEPKTSEKSIIPPCIEQPLRVIFHCNGYYLHALRKGTVVTRTKQSEHNEFTLNFKNNGGDIGLVEIVNYKVGGVLSVVSDGVGKKIVCVKDETESKESKVDENSNDKVEEIEKEDISNDKVELDTDESKCERNDENSEKESNERDANNEVDPDKTGVTKAVDEEGINCINGDKEGLNYPSLLSSEHTHDSETEINSSVDEEEEAVAIKNVKEEDKQWFFVRDTTDGSSKILLKSLSTGEYLGIDTRGKISLTSFPSNTKPCNDDKLNVKITWDVECITGELLYISNPTLNTRIRCDINGFLSLTDAWKGWEVFRFMEVSHGYVKISSWMHSNWVLCSTIEGDVSTCKHVESFVDDNDKCCKWAIEKGDNGGVIIRSKRFGRLLSIQDGVLKTYFVNEELLSMDQENYTTNSDTQSETSDKPKRRNSNLRNRLQRQFSQVSTKSDLNETISQKDTIMWHLEAAHLQTYYFINIQEVQDDNELKPLSIGLFPQVTSNLRKADKIQLIRDTDGVIMKLYLVEQEQYIACLEDGSIVVVDDVNDKNNDWIMEKSLKIGDCIFKSKIYDYYLSFEEEIPEEAEESVINKSLKNFFSNKKEKTYKLIGSKTDQKWKLEPSMPRAISSQKIGIFALGISFEVGTALVMPFALSAVSLVFGVHSMLAQVVVAGLTGAEALASVGIVGAAAYIVFRPEENSLSDDLKDGDNVGEERAWSKRPFSNWKNW